MKAWDHGFRVEVTVLQCFGCDGDDCSGSTAAIRAVARVDM